MYFFGGNLPARVVDLEVFQRSRAGVGQDGGEHGDDAGAEAVTPGIGIQK